MSAPRSPVRIERCTISPTVGHEADAKRAVYPVPNNMPARWRDLRVYVIDPMLEKDQGAVDILRVPYEPLAVDPQTGWPVSGLFAFDLFDTPQGVAACNRDRPCDLDGSAELAQAGYRPDAADARFHVQMVYAVAMATYEAFRVALGRTIGWRPGAHEHGYRPLTLRPFASRQHNAWYSRRDHSLSFGYYPSLGSEGIPEGRFIFSSLSSDIIVHETAHALLDTLKPHFLRPSNPEALAFHEGFADLIAVFHRFAFQGFVRSLIETDRLNFKSNGVAGALAEEFARGMGSDRPLRDVTAGDAHGADGASVHEMGLRLAEAVFYAFERIAVKKATPFIRMATGRTELPPDEPVPLLLLDQLARILSRLAGQFRAICIRAIDFCPPVDIDFGDFLRAMITADTELVVDDDWGYREAIVQGFRQKGIYPHEVTTLSESSLCWNGPLRPGGYTIEAFALQNLRFEGDPGIPARRRDIYEQAVELAARIETDPDLAGEIGLHAIDADHDPPEVVAIRPARRGGPDGQIAFDLVAEVIQARFINADDGRQVVYGGATLIFGPTGEVRYIIRKRVDHVRWQENQLKARDRGYDLKRSPEGWLDYDDEFLTWLCRDYVPD